MSLYVKLVKNPLIASLSNHIEGYPTPINLSYLWGFGSLAGVALVIQIVTGVLLAMHYAPEIHLAFSSVEHIMRDVRGGVALRYIHANGASMFFIVVYIHMFRGLYYGSYFQPRANLWYSGILIFFLMMATAFMGYVLPWGQMSFWGATVITNLFSAIPALGDTIVQTLWGGFSVDNPTLNRFFSLHYFMPFIIAAVAGLHLILLHQQGSNNPLGVNSVYDRIPFYPYFYVKDLFGFFMFVWIFSFFVIYAPNYMGHPDNYIEANPLVTPAHIVPEWYFLPFYAILRTISDKLGGVILMVLAIVILAVLPIVDTSVFRSNFFKPFNLAVFWFFFVNSFALGWIGQEIVESPFIEMSNFVTLFYFIYFLIFLPLFGLLENMVLIRTFFVGYYSNLWEIDSHKTSNNLQWLVLNIDWVVLFLFVSWNLIPFILKNMIDFTVSTLFSLWSVEVFFSWILVFQFVFIGIFLLFLIIYFPKNNKASLTLHKLVSVFILYLVCDVKLSVVPRFDNSFYYNLKFMDWSWLQVNQENSLFFNLFFFYITIMLFIFFFGIIDRFFIANSSEMEFAMLIFFIIIGSLVIFKVHNFMDVILSLEVITLASYVLISFEKKNRFSTYAGIQYFVLGSIPSGMLVLGSGLLYETWGTLVIEDLDVLLSNIYLPSFNDSVYILLDIEDSIVYTLLDLNNKLNIHINKDLIINQTEFLDIESKNNILTFSGIMAFCFIFFNLLFKITAAPFHVWAPSIYGKGPIASVTFLSIFSKAIIFFLIFKILSTFSYSYNIILTPFLLFCGVLSILFGMIGAFTEKLVKRFFVYSSMSHVGFMLVAFALSNLEGASATFHYLPVYILSSFIMWFILLYMGKENRYLTQFKTLINSNYILTIFFGLLLFSMSGIPPLGGFFVKLDVLLVLLESSRFYLNFVLFILSVASFFYYLRVVKIMFFDADNSYIKEKEVNDIRIWLIVILSMILFFYMIIVQKPLLSIQKEILGSLF